jgi:hypothetical protein
MNAKEKQLAISVYIHHWLRAQNRAQRWHRAHLLQTLHSELCRKPFLSIHDFVIKYPWASVFASTNGLTKVAQSLKERSSPFAPTGSGVSHSSDPSSPNV